LLSRLDRIAGWIRLTHPFPSVLDGVVVAAFALLAGGAPEAAARAGLSMTLLQLGIGTTNDVVDAPHDAGRKAGKPIPAGAVPVSAARGLAVALFLAGIGLAWTVEPRLAALSVAVIAVGLAYDLRLKGTVWSWLPFAVGIPLLPICGWLAARGTLEPAFAILLPAAVAAGAALAIGNSLVDVERDRAAGRTSVAAGLGAASAARLEAVLFLLVAAGAGVSVGAGQPLPVALAVTALGTGPVVAALAGAGGGPRRRELAWRIEAIGLAILAVVWTWLVLGG
jgi:4-hydroxybenzoate polyprenyltransferase